MTTGTVFDIQRYSLQDGPGLRTLVFLKGCPLRCLWCSNPESQSRQPELLYDAERCVLCGACVRVCPVGAVSFNSEGTLSFDAELCSHCGSCVTVCPVNARRIAGETMTAAQVTDAVVRDAPFYRRSGGGVTLGGGEPTYQPEFALAILERLKRGGMDTAIETCGHADADMFMRVAGMADHVLFDVKHVDSSRHAELTGVGNELILANLNALVCGHADVTIRYPLIPGCNDSRTDLRAFAALVLDLPRVPPVELVPYHRFGEHKYRLLRRRYRLAGTMPAGAGTVEECCTTLRQCGLSCSAVSH